MDHPACWAAITAFANGMNFLRLECGTGFIAANNTTFPCLLDEEAKENWTSGINSIEVALSIYINYESHLKATKILQVVNSEYLECQSGSAFHPAHYVSYGLKVFFP